MDSSGLRDGPANTDLRLDHVGIATADLAAGRTAMERLGFSLTPLSVHSGSTVPGGPVLPWGSGNHCAMFKEGYLEILGLTDPEKFSSVKGMLSRYEGLHIVAIACAEAQRTHAALTARGVNAEAPRILQRDAAFGTSGTETRKAEFRNIYLDSRQFPEARFIIIEHLTREVLWQPHLLEHPNGAQSIDAVYLASAEPADTVANLSKVLGNPTDRGGLSHFRLEAGSIFVSSPEALRAVASVFEGATVHPAAAVRVKVASLERVRELLIRRGISVRESMGPAADEPTVWVGPRDACGTAIEFIQ